MSVVRFLVEGYFFFVVLCCWTVYNMTQQQKKNSSSRVVINNTNLNPTSTSSQKQQQQQRRRRLLEDGANHYDHHEQQQGQRRRRANNINNNNKRRTSRTTTNNRRRTTTKTTTARRLDDTVQCPCGAIDPRPNLADKVLTARWMVHTLDWGVLTTVSSRSPPLTPTPFGNVYSFVDGSCTNATGTPYFYGSYLDQSFQDMRNNPIASLTLSEATLASTCQVHSSSDPFVTKACVITPIPPAVASQQGSSSDNPTKSKYDDNFPGDPESPLCARLTLTGQLMEITDHQSDEYQFALAALLERHPQMVYWPANHDWTIVKFNITEVWLIDYFGGATILSPEQYYYSTTTTTTGTTTTTTSSALRIGGN